MAATAEDGIAQKHVKLRVTNEDRRAQELSRSFHIGAAPPVVTHLVAQDISKRNNGGNLEQPILDENDE